jgi:hypothetical protein
MTMMMNEMTIKTTVTMHLERLKNELHPGTIQMINK